MHKMDIVVIVHGIVHCIIFISFHHFPIDSFQTKLNWHVACKCKLYLYVQSQRCPLHGNSFDQCCEQLYLDEINGRMNEWCVFAAGVFD